MEFACPHKPPNWYNFVMYEETTTTAEREAFSRFLNERDDLHGHSLEDALAAFRDYQRQLADLRAKVDHAIQSATDENTGPLDDSGFWADSKARLDAKGIPE